MANNQMMQIAQAPADLPRVSMVEIVEHHRRIQEANPGCAGPEYTLVCQRCAKLFQAPLKNSGQQRTSFEYEQLRHALMIQDHTFLPVFCDPCYDQAVIPPENRAMSHPNVVLNVQPPRD